MGPLGLLSPHPGVSYLFPPENQSVADDGSLWGIANANAGTGGQAGAFMYGGGLSSPPAGWSQSLSDTILKIDGKFKVSDRSIVQGGNGNWTLILRRK